MSDLNRWLTERDLSSLGAILAEHDIDLPTLQLLTDADLKEIGLSLGHRRRLLAAIAQGTPATSPDVPTGEITAAAERRNVAVLFVDLADFTALSQEMDPEDLRNLIDAFMALVQTKVGEFGGSVDKQVGDGALAMFGAPRAYGDDGLRAARAALGILDALPQLSERVGRPLAAHAGLSMGEIVAGGAHGVIGTAVNTAARLDALAGNGEIVMDDALRTELGEAVTAMDLGERQLKGLDAPVRLWRLDGLAKPTRSVDKPPLVGRSTELSQILAAVPPALSEGAGSVFLLRGEPGIGKTRLLEEVELRLAADGFATHKGLFLNFGAEGGRDAIRTIMRGLAGVHENDPPSDRAEVAATVTRETGRGPRFRVALGDLLDAPSSTDLERVEASLDPQVRDEGRRDGVDALITRACAQCPQLIAIEDVHWAPPTALSLLEHLARLASEHPVIVVMTTRPDGDPFGRSNRSFGGFGATVLELAPLRSRDAEAFARMRLADKPDAVDSCVRKAEGNPLFLEQLVRTAAAGSDALPGTLQQVVLARIDALDTTDRLAIRAASVFGQRFRLEDLRALIGDAKFNCEPLLERGLLKLEGGDILFGHALLQEGVYRSILKSERRDLHAAAAALFERRDAALQARHLKHARSPEAAAVHLAAAREELRRHRPQSALELARDGALLAQTERLGLDLGLLEAQILLDIGAANDAVGAWERALSKVSMPGDRGLALLGMAGAQRLAGDFDAALATAREAAELLNKHGSAHDQSRAAHLIGNLEFARGEGKACERSHSRALALAREARSPEAEVAALGGLADAAIAQGHMTSAHNTLKRCIQTALEAGLDRTAASYLSIAPLTSFFALDFSGADTRASEALEAARRIGHTRAEYMTHHALEYVLFQRADVAGCRANISNSKHLLERLGNRAFEAYILEKQANLCLLEGDEASAREVLDDAIAVARATSFRLAGARLLAYRAKLAAHRSEARSLADDAFAALEMGSLGLNVLQAHAHCADAALRFGEAEWAHTLARSLHSLADEDEIPWARYMARRTDLLASLSEGTLDNPMIVELTSLRDQAKQLDWRLEERLLSGALAGERKTGIWEAGTWGDGLKGGSS